jgi:hypothetical protein
MNRVTWPPFALMLLLLYFWISPGPCLAGGARVELRDPDGGREIFSAALREGEPVILTWQNSLFGLQVTEVFEARGGLLYLTEVIYAFPGGPPPPAVPPGDAEALYQTGGPFHARGLAKPFREVVYRVGEIGEPKMKIRDHLVDFKKEVGFGGSIVLTVRGTDPP